MLVDGHSVAFRAYYALPASIEDKDGEPANAMYGFMSILFRVVQDQRPTHLAVTFDLGRPFREEFFPKYKAHRAVGPEDLEPQVRKLRRLLAAFDIPIFEVDGFEADDLLATLTEQGCGMGIEVDVLSGDLDVLQLVRPHVRVVSPGQRFSTPVVYDTPRVVERYGVPPGELRDYKALVGDASDGILGVAGVGPKSASELLQRWHSLDAIYAHLDEVASARVRNALAAGRESAYLSRRLVQLRSDAPVQLDLQACRLANYDRERAVAAVREMGFDTLASRVPEF
jgi:DNA polymerase-1